MNKDLAQTLAQRVERIKPSPTLAISARATELQAQGKKVINLSVGEPDFDTPQPIKDEAIRSLQAGHTKYTAVDGTKGLKQAVIQKFERDNGLHYQPNQILISCGAKHSFYNLFSALLNAGDEVIIPAPYWVSYPDMVKLCDAEPVIVKTDRSESFKMSPAKLAAAITNKTRIVILNSPSNPTGLAYTREELKALGDVILEHPAILIASDDIYEHNLWKHIPFVNIINACPALFDRCVVINGVSKAYAMTGWRIGYAAGPAKIIAAMKKVQSQSTSNPASLSQDAAQAALEGDQTCVSEMRDAYKARHDYLVAALQQIPGMICTPSDGTFYTFPSIEGLLNPSKGITNDVEFAEFLLNEADIAIVPGTAFGAPNHIRITYATSMDNLKEAVARLQHTLEKLTTR
ncbi:MAG: aspartate aminotransferase [Gammaproteobacteria bacterium RIFCSPHIGHO2_12_FULL_45_12]|nr:MAG: aspartate aminotransferase [Gammaproteobacteria bacterium RIFCSPHIGHO2_12_FULL_45_12]